MPTCLKDHPFSKEIADRDLWLPSSKAALVSELVEALEERTSVLLTGEPGVGKTCVLRALRARLPEAGFRLTYCHNATLGRRDFYRQLCLALGLAPNATAAAVFYAVSTHVEDLAKERLHPVFIQPARQHPPGRSRRPLRWRTADRVTERDRTAITARVVGGVGTARRTP